MPIIYSDVVIVCAANRPDDDTSLVGGAADPTARPFDNQPSQASDIAMVSDGADTRSVTLEYRDSLGAVQTAVKSLNGTTEVVFGVSTDDILSITTTADVSRTVTFREGAGGNTLHVLNPNEVEAVRQFRKAVAGTSAKDYHEKYFLKNNGSPVTLLEYIEQADPDAQISFALEGSVNGTGTSTNRLTSPGLTFDSAKKSGGDLGTGDAQGIWYQLELDAGEAAGGQDVWTTRVVMQAA